MEARFFGAARPWAAVAAILVGTLCGAVGSAHAAAYRTTNFTVDAPTAQLAREIGESAEAWRKSLAVEWLGQELPRWGQPCPIKASVAPNLGAGGATSFVFDQGQVFGWRMNVQGSRERVLDSVLPHEITHTIFATHFRQPVPRWADEGACTTVEHRSEIAKQERMLLDFLRVRPGERGRGIPFDDMFVMREYPEDVLPLYAQGHSLSVFLIGQKGKREFLAYLADGMQHGDWRKATRDHYGYEHLLALQNSWLDWVKAGRPELGPMASGAMVASHTAPASDVPATFAAAEVPPTPPAEGGATAIVPGGAGELPPAAPPVATTASLGDWTTRPVRHTMNAPPVMGNGPAAQNVRR
ncbi:MAG TPA: hypothetical protein VEQ85_09690 [Lacipirellulaceae bacterium]|nr:hypothetical protein [Lacipirellulaceae bacterium]